MRECLSIHLGKSLWDSFSMFNRAVFEKRGREFRATVVTRTRLPTSGSQL